MQNKAAIYHFTDKSEHRPKICKDQLKALENFSASAGFSAYDIFCDKSLKRRERTEFDRFLSEYVQYNALITKDLYHISKNTGKCMSILKDLWDKGIQVFTLENGTFYWEKAPFSESLRAVTYTCHFGPATEFREVISVRNDVSKLFINKKTEWSLEAQYYDDSLRQRDGEQVQLMDLLDKANCYDILVVHNLNDIHWRTANFCKIRERLRMGIYSLQEGFLPFHED